MLKEWPKSIPFDLEADLSDDGLHCWQSSVLRWLRTHDLDRFEEWIPLLKIKVDYMLEQAGYDTPSAYDLWPLARAWLVQIGARPPLGLQSRVVYSYSDWDAMIDAAAIAALRALPTHLLTPEARSNLKTSLRVAISDGAGDALETAIDFEDDQIGASSDQPVS